MNVVGARLVAPEQEQTAIVRVLLFMLRPCVALLLGLLPLVAEAGPVPPCEGASVPAFGEVGGAPQWRIWSADELRGENWQPARCLAWSGDTRLVAAIASRFRSTDNVFARLSDIGAWPGIKYWSVSKQRWQPLASGVSASDTSIPAVGQERLFVERDENSGETTYRLRVAERSDRRLALATENVTPIRIAIITAFEPSSLQTIAFVQKTGADQWETYQITRVGAGANSLVLRYPGSFLNRLEAVRRYLAGQPTDQQPPLVPH